MLYRPTTRWTWTFFVSLLLEALVVIALEIVCLIEFMTRLRAKADQVTASRVLPSFASFIIVGFLYRLVLAYDTLAQQNTIQVYGIWLYSVVLSIFSGLQYSQFRYNIRVLYDNNAIDDSTWPIYNGILIPIIVLSTMSCCWALYVGWELHKEFSWVVFQKVEADVSMRRRYWAFQILMSILKFDVFFFLGFMLQMAVMPTERSHSVWKVMVSLIPLSCVLLVVTASSIRHENRPWTLAMLIFHTALMAVFAWEFALLYAPQWYVVFLPARMSLALFGSLSIFLSFATIVMIFTCLKNFDKGLKPYVCGEKEARLMGETFETSERQGYSRVLQA